MNGNTLIISLVISLLKSLVITLIAEVGAAFILGLRKKDLVFVILSNIITNPLLCLILNYVLIIGRAYPPTWLIATLEVGAVVTEGFIYYKGLDYIKINPFLLSLLLNIISYFGGKLIP